MRLFVERDVSCAFGDGCSGLVEIDLDTNGAWLPARVMEGPHPNLRTYGATPLRAVATPTAGEVIVHSDWMRVGELVRPAPEYFRRSDGQGSGLGISAHGVALLSSERRSRGARLTLMLADRDGFPRYASIIEERERITFASEVQAGDASADVLYLTLAAAPSPTVRIERQRYAWPEIVKTERP